MVGNVDLSGKTYAELKHILEVHVDYFNKVKADMEAGEMSDRCATAYANVKHEIRRVQTEMSKRDDI